MSHELEISDGAQNHKIQDVCVFSVVEMSVEMEI